MAREFFFLCTHTRVLFFLYFSSLSPLTPLPCRSIHVDIMIHDGVTPYQEATDSESGYNEKKTLEDQNPQYQDAFGNEEGAEVKYKTMKWW